MAFHKLKLYYLKNRTKFAFFIMATGMFTTILMACYLILANQQQRADIRKGQEQTQNLLKGLSCILLILPEDRTEAKVRECVEINHGQNLNYEFFFKQLEENHTMRASPDFIELVKQELRGDRGFRGQDGRDGVDGEDGKDGKDSISTKTVIEKEVAIKGDKGDPGTSGREVEFSYDTVKDRILWRYVGEDIWNVLVDACELTNTCP